MKGSSTALLLQRSAKTAVPRCRYQEQDSPQTLAEGLSEYYRANEGRVLRPDSLSDESRSLFASHDLCHVIFGLGTTIDDEAVADTRTMLSCDVGFGRYMRYLKTNPDAQAIFREVGIGRIVWITLVAVPRLLKALVEGFRMREKWPWDVPADHLAASLASLR